MKHTYTVTLTIDGKTYTATRSSTREYTHAAVRVYLDQNKALILTCGKSRAGLLKNMATNCVAPEYPGTYIVEFDAERRATVSL